MTSAGDGRPYFSLLALHFSPQRLSHPALSTYLKTQRNNNQTGDYPMKSIIMCGVAAFGIPAVCAAQSSVTLYGIVDTTLSVTSNQGGKQNVQMLDGGPALSRWGLQGSEDLGSGLRAIFTLENGFNPNNGTLSQNNRLFGRQAFVGLASDRFGTLKAGRMYDSITNYVGPFGSAQSTIGSVTGHPGDVDDLVGSYRINNSVSYTTPDLAGFAATVMGSLGGQPGSISTNSTYSVGVRYAHGPFKAAAAYGNYNRPNTTMWDGTPTTLGVLLFSAPVFSGYASANSLKITGLGAGYDVGDAAVNVNYTNYRFNGLGSDGGPNPMHFRDGTAAFNTVELNGRYFVSPALMLAGAYQFTNGAGVGGHGAQHYSQFSMIVDYFLSKRFDVYASAAYELANGTNSLGKPAVAAINTVTPSSSNRQALVRIGMREKF
jgi:predicted porin